MVPTTAFPNRIFAHSCSPRSQQTKRRFRFATTLHIRAQPVMREISARQRKGIHASDLILTPRPRTTDPSLSADGNIAVVGGPSDNSDPWVHIRKGDIWILMIITVV